MERLKSFIQKLKVSIYRIEGKSRYGEELIMYHVGKKMTPFYFLKKFYLQFPNIKEEKKIYFWEIKKIRALEKQAHLLFIKIPKFLNFYFKRDFMLMPEYVRQTLDLSKNEKAIRGDFHKNLFKTELRKIRKYGYTYEFSNNPRDIEFFYNRMLIPFIKKRHKDYARIDSFDEAKKFSSMGILFIKQNNKHVAGAALQEKASCIITRMFGVIDGDDTLLRRSVIGAVFSALIKFSKENGFRKLDLGFSNPILSDGVLLYKNKWGARIEYKPYDNILFMLKICKYNEPLKKILKDSPFITIVRNKLGACIFHEGDPSAFKISETNIPITLNYFRGLQYIYVKNFN